MTRRALLVLLVFSFPLPGDCFGEEEPALPKPATKPARKNVKLPGILVDRQNRYVDLASRVCLNEGFLELVACTKGTKEHESIVAVEARPMHIHTALLLLGATNGNPAMRKQVGAEETRWIDIPPRGDPVDVFLVFKNTKGEMVQRPVSDFIAKSNERADEIGVNPNRQENDKANKNTKFPHTFLFAGSLLHGDGPGPRRYLADESGDVISIATFGDEVLCLPFHQTQENGALMWQIAPETLPKVGTKVTLRLRPQAKPNSKTQREETQRTHQ